ncbi:Tail-specific protease [Spirochaetota bacterium]|nr:Tail-specific protease [Spirochaetota bacterium]
MKKNIFLLSLIASMLTSSVNSQTTVDEENFLLAANIRILNQYHFLKKTIDNDFFDAIFENYLAEVDPYKILLTEPEVAELRNFKTPKDNLENILVIPTYTEELINDRIKLLKNKINAILSKPFDFTINETFNSDYTNLPYARNEIELIERWRKRLKYQVISQTLTEVLPDTNFIQAENPLDPSRSNQSPQSVKQNFDKALIQARKNVDDMTQRFLSTIITLKRRDYVNHYVNAVGQTYDEYTSYLPPVQKETFDIRLSGQLEGIGAEIRKASDGLVEVVRIVPGGASYRQKELKAGDMIMKVAQKEQPPVDIRNLTLNETLKLIRGKKGTLIKLTVKKKNGEIVVIPIIRDKIILEETYARSTVLLKDNARYGYLYLPKFYRNFNDDRERTSTTDVHKELDYLNSQNVDGLIFDLRNNGGGSLEDAILMSGLFITEGPIIRVRDNSREYPPYKDTNKDIIFTKPMVVLVNNGSASASEIFAAALQDYERAIVVGQGDKTFGKGTVQTLFSLNKIPEARSYAQDLGYLKFTIQKYYRITGQSTQTQGVRPDIILPSIAIPFSNEKSSFTNDSLRPILFSKWNEFQYPIESLIQKSAARTDRNKTFKNIQKRSNLIQQQQEQTQFSLNYNQAFLKRQNYLKKLAQYKVDLNKNLSFNIIEKKLSTQETQQNGYKEKLEQRSRWYSTLKKDIYLQETLDILIDITKT